MRAIRVWDARLSLIILRRAAVVRRSNSARLRRDLCSNTMTAVMMRRVAAIVNQIMFHIPKTVGTAAGFEPATNGLEGGNDNQSALRASWRKSVFVALPLSYTVRKKWNYTTEGKLEQEGVRWGSNPRLR